MQMQKHQNNCNGSSNWWCHFSKRTISKAYRLAVNAMGKENFTAFKVTEEIGKK
jgi:predicted metal-binding transcription factor (methanogenesis marker protein 9)